MYPKLLQENFCATVRCPRLEDRGFSSSTQFCVTGLHTSKQSMCHPASQESHINISSPPSGLPQAVQHRSSSSGTCSLRALFPAPKGRASATPEARAHVRCQHHLLRLCVIQAAHYLASRPSFTVVPCYTGAATSYKP